MQPSSFWVSRVFQGVAEDDNRSSGSRVGYTLKLRQEGPTHKEQKLDLPWNSQETADDYMALSLSPVPLGRPIFVRG